MIIALFAIALLSISVFEAFVVLLLLYLAYKALGVREGYFCH